MIAIEVAKSLMLIYFIAAVLPALVLLIMIYRQDTIEKEPVGLMIKLLVMGIIAALGAIVLESIGSGVLSYYMEPDDPFYSITLAFLVVAAAEEGMKFILLKAATWRHPAFNYRFDAIVYAVTVSLGFAAFENVGYVIGYGLSVAPVRALVAIPGHLSFAVFMGYFYGRAKLAADLGDSARARRLLRISFITAVLLHGFYDACALTGSAVSSLIFLLFVLVLFINVIKIIRKESRTDERV